jgi:RHS repeat-associated protein
MDMRNRVGWKHAFVRGMSALLVTGLVAQARLATGAPGDIFSSAAPAIGADPPKATDIKDGDASVSTQTGALQYAYPIVVPPGRNGMAPQLALSYSSQAPNFGGIAAGWTLSIPSITEDFSKRLVTRSPQIETQQVANAEDPKADDSFVSSLAGGRPLIAVTEPGIAVDAGVYKRYRAQGDTTYTRYERMAAGWAYRWRALTSDGITMEFGESGLMSKCSAPTDQNAPLTRTRDRFGNEVRYHYSNGVAGECMLVRVSWGWNVTPGATTPDFADVVFGWNKPTPCWDVVPNTQTDYRGGSKVVTGASKLTTITARAYEPGSSSTVLHTRTLSLSYDQAKEACNLSHAPIRMLASIQETAVGVNAPQVVLPPVTFTYNTPTTTLQASPPPEGAPLGRPDLSWGYRHTDRWPTVERMFLDIDGDGLQDLVENASKSSDGKTYECRARWYQNKGRGEGGNVVFGDPTPANPTEPAVAAYINMPRLKWHNLPAPNTTQDSPTAATAEDNELGIEDCALNRQVTTFTNSQGDTFCHNDNNCAAGPMGNPGPYCYPGGTECPGSGTTQPFRTYLAYRWLDMDSDGLVDLVAAIHGNINVYDPELGNRVGHYLGNPPYDGEPAMPGIPGYGEWPVCPGNTDRCVSVGDCFDREAAPAQTCTGVLCTVNWSNVSACVAQSVAANQGAGCANYMAKLGGGPKEAPQGPITPGALNGDPYTRCEGLYPWLVYKNNGNGSFNTIPDVKYQPIPLESDNGDSSLNGPSLTSTDHAYLDFDGDGWNDALLRDASYRQGIYSTWQLWLGDGTGGVRPKRYQFFTRGIQCGAGCTDHGKNAISSFDQVYGQDTFSSVGLLDVNGDGAQDHWLALPNQNANIAFNHGQHHQLYVPGRGGETDTPFLNGSYAVKPGADAFVNRDPVTLPGGLVQSGTTFARRRIVDVDGDGRQDVVEWTTNQNELEVPKVFFNLGGQFNAPGMPYPGNPRGARRRTLATTGNTWHLVDDLMDLDGDAIPEALYYEQDGFRRAIPTSAQPPRLLSAISNGRGLTTQISYAQLHDKAYVTQSANEFWWDGRPKASPRAQWVVASMTTIDAFPTSSSATTKYHYKHPRFGADDEERYSFRGFAEVVTTSPGPTGVANGKRTIQRYDYEVDWSGRLVETLVMPDESSTAVHSISTTSWEAHTLFDGALTTYHPSRVEQLTCSVQQDEGSCRASPAGRTQTTSTWKPYPEGPAANHILNAEVNAVLQAGTAAADGDRSTGTHYQLDLGPALYLFHPDVTTRSHRTAGVWAVYAKSASTWDPVYGTQLTSETWVDSDDDHRAITRTEYDPATGNVLQRWKPKQNATGGPAMTLTYDARKLFVATETNERGHVLEFKWEYGTGTKVQTDGPNARTCSGSACPPSNPALYPLKEQQKLDIDGLGRTVARWITFGSDGSVYTLTQVERTAYANGSMTIPASTTREAVIETGVTSPRWTKETTLLDGHGRPIQSTNYVFGSAAADAVTTYQYGPDGALVAVSMPDPSLPSSAGAVTYTYGHDSLGRPTWIRRPDGASAQSGIDIQYDGLTQTTTEIVGGDGGVPATTTTINDAFGRLQYVDEHDGGTMWRRTQYTYGPDDLVSSVTDPQGVKTALGHDWAGHRIKITRPGATPGAQPDGTCMGLVGTTGCRHWIYTYDLNGNEVSEQVPGSTASATDANYLTTTIYDHLDRPESKVIGQRTITDPVDQALFGTNTETFSWDFVAYNGKGRLYQWRSYDPSGVQVSRSLYFTNAQAQPHLTSQLFNSAGYSNLSRSALEEWSPLGTRINIEHGERIGTSPNQYETWTRTRLDGRGLPSSLELVTVNTVSGTTTSRIAGVQTRNVAGLVTKRRNNTSGTMNYVESNWSYDKLGRVVDQQVQKSETIPLFGTTITPVARQQLTYFGNDDPKTLQHTLGTFSNRAFTFTYDHRHQITSAKVDGGSFFSGTYGYGAAGRLASADVAQAGQPLGSEVKPRNVNYVYGGIDPEQVTALVTPQGVTFASYTYDAAGNQTSRSYPATGERWDYLYDGKDQLRRATKFVNNVEQGREEYWYDNNGQRTQVVKRPVGGNKSLIWFLKDTEYHFDTNGALTKTYAHASLGTPVARIERLPSTPTGTFEYQFHGLASNTLATVSTGGTINARFSYGPFGEVLEATDAGGATAGIAVHKRRFNDKYQDDISALTYYGFRYYDKMSLTWTQSDPLYRFAPDAAWVEPRKSLLYTADLNNPLRYIDPDGRSTSLALDAGKVGFAAVRVAPIPLKPLVAVGAVAAVAIAFVTPDLSKVKEAFDEVAEFGIGPSERHDNWTNWDKRAIEKNRRESVDLGQMWNEAVEAGKQGTSGTASKAEKPRFVGEPNGTLVDTEATPRGSYDQPNGGRTDVLQGEDHGAGQSHTHDPIVNTNPKTGKTFVNGRQQPGRPVSAEDVKNIIEGVATPSAPKGR